ncbi:hypothetical protein NIES267_33040 [Calothrix parasitica NIES-267]|uniref:DUF4303 domain-containing protein n=1 Tax=Calothrix parasitica NIES-267 TaxID=1973488 RepID=A0A1Z4LRE3_9CYAN|nr:hypothetical protein NIES267_33040 [Calothrix parasitica NIES-267]
MTNTNLLKWLNRDDTELVNTIKSEVGQHVSKIHAISVNFYGYAILPGTSYSVDNLVAAFNRETDITPENTTDTYYRYSVDEWENYEHGEFINTNKLINSINSQFQQLHIKEDSNNFLMDEFEIAHVTKLHNAILKALIELRYDGIFGSNDNFVIIWIPDSDDEIIYQSAKVLNSASVYETFMAEFG